MFDCKKLLETNSIKFDINSPNNQNDIKTILKVTESVFNLRLKFQINNKIWRATNSRWMILGCQKLLKSNPIKFDINSPKYQNYLKFFIQVAESVVNLYFKFHLNIQI